MKMPDQTGLIRGLRLAYRKRLPAIRLTRPDFDLLTAREWLAAHNFDTTRVLTRPAHYLFLRGKLAEPTRTLDIELLDAQRVVALIDADSPSLVALSRRRWVTLEDACSLWVRNKALTR